MRRRLLLVCALVCLGAADTAHAESVTFSYTGAEQTFTVPAGVSSLQVVAVGATGGGTGSSSSGTVQAGGAGGQASGVFNVVPGQILYVLVGGVGGAPTVSGPGAGGFNGGAPGGPAGTCGGCSVSQVGAGGGGASDIRTEPVSGGAGSLASRLIAAGGGGGAGGALNGGYTGGAGGAAGENGKKGAGLANGDGGGAGTSGAGGAGGAEASACDGSQAGSSGGLGTGGAGGGGGVAPGSGGGGGGGWYGGGGGASGCNDPSVFGPGSGGGGGSSYFSAAVSGGATAAGTGPASVTISYTVVFPPDTVKPKLTAMALSPSRFVAANTGPVVQPAAVGTRIFYNLSEPARVTFKVERALRGHRKGRRCVRRGTGRRCTRYMRMKGSFVHSGTAGANALRFMGRLRGHALKRGKYRLVAVATDAAGNRSASVRRSFRIK